MALSAATSLQSDDALASGRPSAFRVEVLSDLGEAEPAWRSLEATATLSPYQRFDWVASYVAALPRARAGVRVAIVRDGGGVAAIFPLCLSGRLGIRLAVPVGERHANLFLPLLRPGLIEALGPERARHMLADVGNGLGAHAVLLHDVPRRWNGAANPFGASGASGANAIHRLDLEEDGEATLKRSMSADARKKLRSKERQLAGRGRLDFIHAGAEAEVDLLLEVFFRQKRERFRQQGITDPFAAAEVQAFLRRAALAGLAENRPAIEVYGLALDGRPIAVFGGAASAERLSGMFVSFEQGELARFSPGELLVTKVVRRQCELGRRVFDLGVGEARYKRAICDGVDDLALVAIGLTLPGRAYLALAGLASAAKAKVKRSERAMSAIGRVRRLRAGFGRG